MRSSRNLRVDTEEGVLLCSLRGKFRTRESSGCQPVAGDRVVVSKLDRAEGVLEQVLPRRTEVQRATAGGRLVLVAANVDGLLVVLSARDPPPRWSLVDRMLVAAYRDDLEAAICLNKWDQVEGADVERKSLEEVLKLYRSLGYVSFAVSARDGAGLEDLARWLHDRVTVFSGHSGVGKSTLLNRLVPDLDLETLEVNPVTGKGRHTTTRVLLLPLPGGGYAVDTPGFREFQPVDLPPAELGRHYPEFRDHVARCRFSDCLHQGEPKCAVRQALEAGRISKFRYDNYLQVLRALLQAESARSRRH
jgi:ribosome biogenesis GTPase